jgi:glutamine amidotransferase
MIIVIDYGMGNLGSIANMIKKVGYKCIITSDLEEIKKATKLILPGVGSFDNGMKNLEKLGMIEVLNQKVLVEKTPILGICLGMQLLTNSSEEGKEKV